MSKCVKFIKICVLTSFTIIGIFLLYYYWPVSLEESIQVWNENGDEATLFVNFEIYRRIVISPKYVGRITFNGIRYEFICFDSIQGAPLGIKLFCKSLNGEMVYLGFLRKAGAVLAPMETIQFSMTEWNSHMVSVSLLIDGEHWVSGNLKSNIG